MRVYECECTGCGAEGEFLAELKDYNNPPPCRHCGEPSKRVIRTAPRSHVKGNFDAFQSTVDLSVIRNERDLREHNKRNDVISLADGYSTEALLNHKGIPKEQPRNVKADLVSAYEDVKQGYRPKIANEGDTIH